MNNDLNELSSMTHSNSEENEEDVKTIVALS